MNVQACIELHNRIVKYAVDKISPHKTIDVTRSWFNFYGDETEDIRATLSQDVISFLEGVDVVDVDELSFLPVFQGLALPSELRSEFKAANILTLYRSIHAESDDLGLIYDMNTNRCCFLPTVDDEPGPSWHWYTLDMALTHYWEKIELGKFVFRPAEAEWSMVPYSEAELHPTLLSWDAYVDMIIERLPEEERKTAEGLEKEFGWFTERFDTLDLTDTKGLLDELTRVRFIPCSQA